MVKQHRKSTPSTEEFFSPVAEMVNLVWQRKSKKNLEYKNIHLIFVLQKLNTMSFTIEKLKPYKYEGDKKWTVTADLRGLETFDNCDSNYDVVERLKENGVMTERTDEDSEYCQFFAYFSTKQSAENFIKKLGKYVEKRKQLINSL